jgi:hypothetical protein
MQYSRDPFTIAIKPAFRLSRDWAARQGVPWRLTLEEFIALWRPHWFKRGPTRQGLILCRLAHRGPFELGNVYIGTRSEYVTEWHAIRRRARATLRIEAAR